VAYGKNFKILTEKLSKEQYVLTQCGTEQPSDSDMDAVAPLEDGYQRKHFTIPLQSAVADSTVTSGFLTKLDVQDRVAFVDSYSTGPCLQQAMQCDAILESSYGGNSTVRAQQLDSVDVAFMDCSGSCTDLRARSNAVHFPATKDSGNLHSAEYIKFMAAFFNLEGLANELFESSVAAYKQSRITSNSPVIAWISSSDYATAFVLSQASYKKELVEAVGGENLDASTLSSDFATSDAVYGNPAAGKSYSLEWNGDKDSAAQKFAQSLVGVDIVIDETYAPDPSSYTLESFLSSFSLNSSSDLKFIKNKMVMRVDGTISEALGLDWFESRVANPEWAAQGLARVVHPDESMLRKYFRNVAKDEQPEILTASMCDRELPRCQQTAAPQALKMLLLQDPTSHASAPVAAGLLLSSLVLVSMA